MGDKLFFKQVREFDDLASKLILTSAKNGFFNINGNNSSIGVRGSDEKIVFEAIKKAGEDYTYKPTFVDPSCGQGIPLVLSAKMGYDTYGSDIENGIVKITNKLILNLEKKNVIPKGNIKKIIQGDLLDLKTYNSLGVDFSDVDIFYNYTFRSIQKHFFHLFSDSAKQGAKLIHIPGYKKIKRNSLLDLMDNIELFYEHPENIYQIYTKK
ncbi:hypothetical protein H8D83_01840 [Candidatus Woesearchaeota archaeon]|nr:hypothetical protein [Candidatus Woesearchaeota archaeon]MBL7050695.1 hypothetical protein [Candidatus Woesearchaeota archaeon]